MAWPQAPAPQPAAAPGRSSTNSLAPILTAVGGVLTFLFSFVQIFRVDAIDAGWSVWTTGFAPGLFGVGTWIPIFALVAAGIALARMLVVGLDDKEVLGFRPAQLQLVAVAFAVLLWFGYVVSILFSDTDGGGDIQLGLGILLLFVSLAITTAGTVLGLMPTASSGSSLGAPAPPPAGQWQATPDAAAAWVAPAGVDPGGPTASTGDPARPVDTWQPPPPFAPPAAPSWTPAAAPDAPTAPGAWDPATAAIPPAPPAPPAPPWEPPPAPGSPPAWEPPSQRPPEPSAPQPWEQPPPAPAPPSWEQPAPAAPQRPPDQPWPGSPSQPWEQPHAPAPQPWEPPSPQHPADPQPWEPSSAVPPQPWAQSAPEPPADQWAPPSEPGPGVADPALPASDGTPPPAPSSSGGVLYDPGTQVIPGPPPAPAPDDPPPGGDPPPPPA